MTRVRLEPLESLDDAGEIWDELASASRNIFATREWATLWWRHFGTGRTLRASLCRSESGRVLAILPLYQFSDRPLALVRFVGHGPADQLGPICAPADRATAKRALRHAVDALEDDIFLAEYLPASEGWNVLPGARVLRREASPILQFKGRTWDEVLASWSSNRRQQARRLERRLQREHGLRYRLSADPDQLPHDLNTLFRLHEARWSGAVSAFSGRSVLFHRDFAAAALERGWLRLWFLEADGAPVAAWYGFRFANVESFYQAGRDPAWENRSVGLVLLLHSIRSALEDGMTEYRFLRGAESFKYRFASHDPAVETIGVGCSRLGSAALAAGAVLPGALLKPLRPHIAG